MKKIVLFSSVLALVLFSCGTTKNVVDTQRTTEKTSHQKSSSSLPFPHNDGAYQEAYSWRRNKEDATMIQIKNSNIDSLRYSSVDRYVSEVVRKINSTARSDFERAKMAHDIIALTISYDAENFWRGTIPAQDYASVLARGTAVCEGFSNTFKHFCDVLGIPCRVVHGYARGVGTKAGNESSSYKSNHAWNIITIKGRQYQIDCTWDEGFLQGRGSVKDYSTVWLFAQPECFIYTHFPDFAADQLLSRPLSYSAFLQLPSLRPNFFDAVASVSDFKVINRCNGTFSLSFTERSGQALSCTIKEDGGSEFVKNADFAKRNGETSQMLFSLPKATQYNIKLFQKNADMDESRYCGEFYLNATATSSVRFPQTFTNYGIENDGVVIAPIEAPLVRGKSYTFTVQSRYNDVALVINSQWTYLKNDGTGTFSAEATIPFDAEKVSLNVKNASGKYWSIASYDLQ